MSPAQQAVLTVAVLGAACAPDQGVARGADSSAVAALVSARLAAANAGDTAAWHRLVAEDALWTGPALPVATTTEVLAEIASNRLTRPVPQDVRQLTVHLYGSVAQVTYVILAHQPAEPPSSGKRFRKTDTYVRRGGTWVLIGGTELLLPFRPEVHPSPEQVATLFGRYLLGQTDTLTVRPGAGGHLVLDGSGAVDTLLAEDDSTYFVDGDAGSWIFGHVASGRVGVLVYRSQGQTDITLSRIP